MNPLGENWRKLLLLRRRPQMESELEEEMRFHLEMQAEENRAEGLSDEEAAHAARRQFGNTARLGERSREAWEWPVLESWIQDARYALRGLRASPGFLAVAILSLALGIGVNVAVFSFVNVLFLRPLPGVPDPGSLVSVYPRNRASGGFTSCSYPEFEYYRDHNRTLSGVLAYLRIPMTLRAGGQAERIHGELVSPNYFTVLDVKPALGRLFTAGEAEAPGSGAVVVLSHGFWERRFGADPGVLGRSVRLGDGSFTIIGVAPRGYQGIVLDWYGPPSAWVPVTMYRQAVPPLAEVDALGSWGMQSYPLVARLRPGVSLEAAAADLAVISARLTSQRREAMGRSLAEYAETVPELFPASQARFWPGFRRNVFDFLALLSAVAGLVLLLAYVNVANLVVARAARRQREVAIRLSLGAGRVRLMRQWVTENLVLGGLGGLAALLVAAATAWFLGGFHQMFRAPVRLDIALDGRVLAFALILSAITGAALAVFPMRLASRLDLNRMLKSDTGTPGGTRLRAQNGLVAGQVALSVVLVVGAGLFVRTLANAYAADPTFRPEEVLLTDLDVASAGYDERRGGALYAQLLERVRALPGVRAAALVFVVPLGGRRGGTNVETGPDETGRRKKVQVGFNVVSPGYFRTVGIPVVRGRDFNASDRPGAAPVALINEEMARRLFPGREPLGVQFRVEWPPAGLVEVVGVVRDGRFRSYRSEIEPTVYLPLAQRFLRSMNLEVRGTGGVERLLPAVRRELAALDPDFPLTGAQTLAAHFDNALSQERLTASLLSGLGLLALALAAIGIYGMLSYATAQRTREIGVRMALGAAGGRVRRVVLGRLLRLIAIGLGVGMAAAYPLARLVRSRLFGVEPGDPLVYLAAAAVLIAAGLLAGYVPARRASRVDPVVALRCE
ncbi:MAG: ABC transporter permease [Bryobacterales bacterium]|nr:ABC transporter permease [Bryobacterales bacterium]